MVSCPYVTLGVSQDATNEEIKAKFRKLSLETHPDIRGGCPERFKQISSAASVLTNEKNRQAYDRKRSIFQTFHRTSEGSGGMSPPHANASAGRHSSARAPGWMGALESMFRPRNFILGSMAIYATISTIDYVLGLNGKRTTSGRADTPMVQAWHNPQTGRFETPAPWDPVYRKLKPELSYVERDKVHARQR